MVIEIPLHRNQKTSLTYKVNTIAADNLATQGRGNTNHGIDDLILEYVDISSARIEKDTNAISISVHYFHFSLIKFVFVQ